MAEAGLWKDCAMNAVHAAVITSRQAMLRLFTKPSAKEFPFSM